MEPQPSKNFGSNEPWDIGDLWQPVLYWYLLLWAIWLLGLWISHWWHFFATILWSLKSLSLFKIEAPSSSYWFVHKPFFSAVHSIDKYCMFPVPVLYIDEYWMFTQFFNTSISMTPFSSFYEPTLMYAGLDDDVRTSRWRCFPLGTNLLCTMTLVASSYGLSSWNDFFDNYRFTDGLSFFLMLKTARFR